MLSPGTQLGHFEIVGHLGSGGMGEVYRAKDAKLGREVAIKVLPEGFARDAERLARFEREAKILASLKHENIGHLYDFHEEGDVRYLWWVPQCIRDEFSVILIMNFVELIRNESAIQTESTVTG